MTKTDYLNYASDLRRIANWVARGQKEKLPIIAKFLKSTRNNREVNEILNKYGVNMNLEKAFAKKKDRIFLAEQALLSSIKLQHLWKEVAP